MASLFAPRLITNDPAIGQRSTATDNDGVGRLIACVLSVD
jgi:hypothetical protein